VRLLLVLPAELASTSMQCTRGLRSHQSSAPLQYDSTEQSKPRLSREMSSIQLAIPFTICVLGFEPLLLAFAAQPVNNLFGNLSASVPLISSVPTC